MEAFTLFELNEHIRRVLALNFEAPVWVKCEISQIKESRGQYYLELVQKDEQTDEVIAHSSAAMWSRNYWFIKKKHGQIVDDLLQDGVELKLKVKVTFHERYGLKLLVEDLDTAFTIGQIEIRRREIIEKLRKDGLLERNRMLPLSPVLQKIAVISSSGAAGLQDFRNQLQQNRFGYAYQVELFESAVQGTQVEQNVTSQIAKIEASGGYDCIAIIRGGGSKIDLAAFDSYAIAASIAGSQYPVLIGIGHDVDQTVLDLACHTSLKTPTAVAEFLIQHNFHFEESIGELGMHIRTGTERLLEKHRNFVLRAAEMLKYLPARHIHSASQQLTYHLERLGQFALSRIDKASRNLEVIEEKLFLLDPVQVLKKGYSITTLNGKTVRSVQEAGAGDELQTTLADGSIISEVKTTEHG